MRSQSIVKENLSRCITRLEHLSGAQPALTILGYHSISSEGTLLDIPYDLFVEQIQFLKENFDLVSIDWVLDCLQNGGAPSRPAVALTFDDGYQDLEDSVVPLLEQNGIPGAIFVMSRPESANRAQLGSSKEVLSPQSIRALQRRGWTIGCHGATHIDLTQPGVDLDAEIMQAKELLQADIEGEVKYFAYPKGKCSAEVVRRTREAGFVAAFMASPAVLSRRTDWMKIPRIFVDARHTRNQFGALFTYWGNYYLRVREALMRAN